MVLNTPPAAFATSNNPWHVFHSFLLRPGSAHRYKT